MKKTRSFETIMKVAFYDLDPVHVVWHGNYFKYFDVARFGLFEQAGIDLYKYSIYKNCIFPITKTNTKFIAPLRYGDEFLCKATLVDASVKIIIDFEIRRLKDDLLCTKASSDQVAVKVPEMETLFEIPDDIKKPLLEF